MVKYLAKVLIRQILKFFWFFPVNPLKLCFQSFRGLQPTCNPLYIFTFLSEQHPEYKYVWLVNEIPEQKDEKILFVKKHSFRWFYEILTSKVIITNNGFYAYIPFRKETILIETWHGGGAYKKVGSSFEAKNKKGMEYKSLLYYSRHLKYYISSSKIFTQIMSKSSLVDEKKFLPIGMPRNDIFFNEELTALTNKKIREKVGLKQDDFVVLYAPTYRGTTKDSNFDSVLDVQRLKIVVQKRIGKKVLVLFRGHHLLRSLSPISDFDFDVSSMPVMQELLCATDMLITDYSSSMWDFSFLKRPCFLFVPDFDHYHDNRGFYTDPNDWGFPICRNNKELEFAITEFDRNNYLHAIEKHHKNLGSYESGTATETVANLIVDEIEK